MDSNGDGLFNYLRIDVALVLDVGGTITIRAVLNDDIDMGRLTETSAQPSLAAGQQTLSILLDGTDIYNGGVDGPYYAHLTLLSEVGVVLDADTHLTSAYGFVDFQPFAARIVPPSSDRTMDNDTDGLADWVDIGVTLDVATPGSYTLASLLTDPTYVVALRGTQTQFLAAGRITLHQLLPGYPLRIWGINGPYMVTTSVYDPLGRVIDFLYIETASYASSSFETAPVRLVSPHSDAGRDTDGDGLFNELRVDVVVDSERTGTFAVRGQLHTGGGVLLGSSAVSLVLAPGTSTSPLTFQSPAIRDSGVDGPYRVVLEMYDTMSLLVATGTHWTGAYDNLQFQPRSVSLADSHEDLGVDLNGNGKFEALRLTVHLDATTPATIRLDAALRQGILAPDLVRVSVSAVVSPGPQALTVDFSGASILSAGVEGPYRIWIGLFTGGQAPVEEASHRTDAYALADFEHAALHRIDGPVGEFSEDIDGDGQANRLRVRISANVTGRDRYRLDGTLSRDGIQVGHASVTEGLDPGLGFLDLVFAGPAIRASGMDGPYNLDLSLHSSTGTLLASSVASTLVYPSASFESAESVNISGAVRSYATGLPLANATVRLVDYDNAFSADAVTGADGVFVLAAYAGTYWVVADHPEGQARLMRTTFAASAQLDLLLAPPARLGIHGSLTWGGWNELVLSVKYVFMTDSPAVRLDLDWVRGDRDGYVDDGEAAILPDAPDRLRDLIDAGHTGKRLRVNGASYTAVGPPSTRDGIVGQVGSSQPPTREVYRPFASTWRITSPSRLGIALDMEYDTNAVDHVLRLYTPTSYRYVSCNVTVDIIIRARQGAVPIVIDALVPPEGTNTEPVAFMDLLFYKQTGYPITTPVAPTSLSGSVAGSNVSLAWPRTMSNTDGSRIANLAGYHLYRAPAGGSFVRVNGLIATESYLDSPGVGGFTYAVAAVNTDGVESAWSQAYTAVLGDLSGSGGDLVSVERPADEARPIGGQGGVVGPPSVAILVAGMFVLPPILAVLWIFLARRSGRTRSSKDRGKRGADL